MTRLATLLALTDLSAPSRHAVARAALLAKDAGARLELLHVVEASAVEQLSALLGADAAAVTHRLLDEARLDLRQLAAAACEPYRISPAVPLATGTPLNEIPNRADACDADVILFNAFTVPFESKMRYAGVDEEKIQYGRNGAQHEAERNMHAIAQQAGLAPRDYLEVIAQGDAAQRILEQEQEHDIDLIVMGKHGTSMTEELLLGSTTKHVLAQASSDALVSH